MAIWLLAVLALAAADRCHMAPQSLYPPPASTALEWVDIDLDKAPEVCCCSRPIAADCPGPLDRGRRAQGQGDRGHDHAGCRSHSREASFRAAEPHSQKRRAHLQLLPQALRRRAHVRAAICTLKEFEVIFVCVFVFSLDFNALSVAFPRPPVSDWSSSFCSTLPTSSRARAPPSLPRTPRATSFTRATWTLACSSAGTRPMSRGRWRSCCARCSLTPASCRMARNSTAPLCLLV